MMRELAVIRDYEVRAIGVEQGIVRYQATHVVLPRHAIIELLEPTASREAAVVLMRRACILDALRHPGVPRVFECGRLDGQPWFAFEDCEGVPLEEELQSRRFDVPELLDLMQQVASILACAHARGVCHRNVTSSTILRGSNLILTGWEHACLHADQRTDIHALAKVALEALADRIAVPAALATLLARMLADDLRMRPTAAQVVASIRALRESSAATNSRDPLPHDGLDAAIASLIDEQPDEIVIDVEDDEEILLEQSRSSRWTPQFAVQPPVPESADIQPRRRTQPRIALKPSATGDLCDKR